MREIAQGSFLLQVCFSLFLMNVYVILARKKPANKETDFPDSSNESVEDHPLHS